jgi:hypothetical protein
MRALDARSVARRLLDRLGEPRRIAEKHFVAAVAFDEAKQA